MLHFNSEHHFCLQCRQRVQTLQTSDSVISVTHTKALECAMSLHYCYIHFSFYFVFFRNLVPSFYPVFRFASCFVQTIRLCWVHWWNTYWQSSACSSQLSLLSWVPVSQIWSCYTILKVLFYHYRHQYLKHWENTNKREKTKLITVICGCEMQLVSVATIAAASIYSISTFRPLWSPSGQDVICAFFTAVWRTFTGHLSMNLNVSLVHSLTNHQCSGFPHHATCLPRMELAVSDLQHLF